MAKLVARTALDMTAWDTTYSDSGDSQIGDHDDTHFVADSGIHTFTFGGTGFTYESFLGETIPTGGTVTSLAVRGDHGLEFNLTHTSVPVVDIAGFVLASDWSGLENEVFAGKDTIIGSTRADSLMGLGGSDTLTGGTGRDHFVYTDVSESTGVNFDRITDFSAADDKFVLQTVVHHMDDDIVGGRLTHNHFDANLAHALGPHHLHAGNAVLYTPSVGTYAEETFLIVDANGVAGYQAGQDYVIDVTGATGDITSHSFLLG